MLTKRRSTIFRQHHHLRPHRRLTATAPLAVLVMMMLAAGCQGRSDQHWMASMIESWSPPSPARIAQDAFNEYDPDRRRKAVSLLAAAPFGGEEVYVRMYRNRIGDDDATVRAAAAQALGMHGGVDDAELLVPLLEDRRSFVRWEAAKALQRIHNPIAVPALMRAVVRDEDVDVRMAAAHALGQYAEPRVLDALIGALNDRNFGVVNAAREALVTLTGEDHGIDSRDWLSWSRQNRRELFANGQPYRYQPYDPPPSFVERMRFWRERTPAEPRPPVGIEPAEPDGDGTSS